MLKRLPCAQNINILWTYPFAVNCLSEEKFPVSETLKIIEGLNLYKTDKWWCAVVLMESFGKKQIGVYLWNKKSDQWKRRQKFVIHNKDEWGRIKEKVEKLIPNLP